MALSVNGVIFTGRTSMGSSPPTENYITTPAATPSEFGDAFEGGFYAGLIWNQLVQSATSSLIATGTKVFTVADMNITPIVYSGQTLEVRSRADPNNKMVGIVTGALGTSLTLNITSIGGSGTFGDWSIMSQYRVLVSPKATGENSSIAWKEFGATAPSGTITVSEGRMATLAMVAAGSNTDFPAAHWSNNLSIGGYSDWYSPSRDELQMCWHNLKPTSDNNYVGTDRPSSTYNYTLLGSFGDSSTAQGVILNSNPQYPANTTSVPAQVAAGKNFRTGESEAFAYGAYVYQSSSSFFVSGISANYWLTYFHSSIPGYQDRDASTSYLRAVRRSII